MAISAAVRNDLIELAVIANNAAPGTTLLAELVALSEAGKTLTQIAETLVARSAFTSTYPTHQTSTEFGTEWIANLLPEANAALQAECVIIVEGHINGGGSIAALLVEVQTFMSTNTSANLVTHISNFNNKVKVATYHTIDKEAAAEWTIPSSVDSTAASVVTGKAAVDTALAPATAAAATTYTLTASASAVNEGDSGQANLVYNLSLDKAAEASTVINFETLTTGTATAGVDFDSTSGSVTFKAGEQNASVTVKVTGDATFEAAENVNVSFSGSSLVASVTASGTISNDDTDPDTLAQAKTLTTGKNTFTTGKGDDTFDGTTSGSLDTIDTIDGGAGSDTLEATMGGESIRPTLSNIETISITSSTGANTLDTRSITGATIYNSESGSQNLTLNNLSSVPAINLNSDTGATTINFTDAAIAGTSDDLALGVNNHSGNVTITDGGGTVNELEALTITSTSLASTIATLTTTGAETSTLNIKGDADLTITNALSAKVTTISAGTASGNVSVVSGATTTTVTTGSGNDTVTTGAGNDTVTTGAGNDSVTSGAGNDTVTAGAGNDTVTFGTGALTLADTIVGGAGTDSIKYSADEVITDKDFTLVTGVETVTGAANVNITGVLGDLAAAAGVKTLTFTDTGGNDAVTVDADGPAALTVNLDDDATNANSIAMAALYAGVLTVNADADEIDSRASTITGGKGSDVLNIKADGNAIAAADLASVTKVETFNITGTTASQSVILDNNNATYTTAAVYETLTVDASGLTTGVATINADAEVDGKVIIKSGGGADIITISSSANFGDTITTGAGNDTINVSEAADLTKADTITAGAGTDKIVMLADSTVTDAMFTLVTGVGTVTSGADKDLDITLGDVAAAAGITTVTLAGTASGDTDTVAIDKDGPAAITVNFDTDATVKNSVIANALYAGVVTVKADDAELDTTASTFTGGTGNDILEIKATGNAASELSLVTNVETFKITGTTLASGATLNDANATFTNATTYQTITVDASALTTGVATIDADAEADAKVVIKGGGGADIITASTSTNLGDTISGNAGNDTVHIATGSFTSADTIDGGAGTDIISLATDGSTVVDADFTLVTNVETLTTAAGSQLTKATIGALAQAAGITKVVLADTTAIDKLVIGAGFTNDLTVDFDADAASGGNNVDASAYTGVLTVTAADDDLDSNASTIKGSAGTNDHVKITTTSGLDVVKTTGFTGVEKISTVGALGGVSITTADALIASGKNLAVDLTSGDNDANTVNAAAEKDGTVTVTADASGAHIITLGQGNDSYTHTGTAGVSTVVATKGNNIITTGGGADIITLGTGTDTVTGGAGNDVIVGTGPTKAATVTTSRNFTSADVIDGGAGTDSLQLTTDGMTIVDTDFSGLTSIETLTTGTNKQIAIATLGAKAMAAGLKTVTFNDAGGSDKVVVSAAFTSALTVNGDVDTAANTVDGSASAAVITFKAPDSSLDATANVLKGGTTLSDTLVITASGSAIAAADTVNWSGFETIKTAANGVFGLTTSDGNIAAGVTLTINTESMTSTVATIDASAELDGNVNVMLKGSGDHIITLGAGNDTISTHVVTTGAITATLTAGNNTVTTLGGADIIVLGTGNDIVSVGAGDDVIKAINGDLNQNDVITAGGGANSISYTNASTVRDSDFTNVTDVQTVNMVGDFAGNITLGALAAATGVVAVNFTDADTADVLTIGAGFTNNMSVNFAADGAVHTVNAAAYTKVLTVNLLTSELDSNELALVGGTGTADHLIVTIDADDNLQLDGMTGIEKITTVAAAANMDLTTIDANVAKGKTLTIDVTSMDGDAFTFDGKAEIDGNFVIKSDGTGAHIITLGQGADSYNATGTPSSGVDTVVATKGANIIKVGDGVDIITLGIGTDTISVGPTGDADLIKVVAAASMVTDTAVITDWNTTNVILLTFAIVNTNRTLVALDDGADGADGNSLVTILAAGAWDLGNSDTVDNSTQLALTSTVAITSSSMAESALEYGGTHQLQNAGAKAAGDTFLVFWDDNVNTYIGRATVNSVVADDAYFGVGSIDITQLIKLTGIAASSTIVAGDVTYA